MNYPQRTQRNLSTRAGALCAATSKWNSLKPACQPRATQQKKNCIATIHHLAHRDSRRAHISRHFPRMRRISLYEHVSQNIGGAAAKGQRRFLCATYIPESTRRQCFRHCASGRTTLCRAAHTPCPLCRRAHATRTQPLCLHIVSSSMPRFNDARVHAAKLHAWHILGMWVV